jgi:hypothetical protein
MDFVNGCPFHNAYGSIIRNGIILVFLFWYHNQVNRTQINGKNRNASISMFSIHKIFFILAITNIVHLINIFSREFLIGILFIITLHILIKDTNVIRAPFLLERGKLTLQKVTLWQLYVLWETQEYKNSRLLRTTIHFQIFWYSEICTRYLF